MLNDFIITSWYQRPRLISYLLFPFSLLYGLIIKIRRFFYRINLMKVHQLKVPVIVVGNLTVGGNGKTPLVAYLADYLKAQGFKPGIVARGYKAKAETWPQVVNAESDPILVGDEAVMLAQQTGLPVIVAPDRVVAAEKLISDFNCNLIISDDGLQHYALARDIEILVLDGQRRLGNGFCLPAGPLRESAERLSQVDFVLVNGGVAETSELQMQLIPSGIYNLLNPEQQWLLPLEKSIKVHAVAGIGFPQRYFNSLQQLGFEVIPHPFPDHHCFTSADIDFKDFPVIMTRKDAVKCRAFADDRHWYLEVKASLPQVFIEQLIRMPCLHKGRD